MAIEFVEWEAWFVDVPKQDKVLRFKSPDMEDIKELPTDGCLAIAIRYSDMSFHSLIGYDWYWIAEGPDGRYIAGCEVENREIQIQSDIKKRYVNPFLIRGIWTTPQRMKEVQDEMLGANQEWHNKGTPRNQSIDGE